MRQHLTRDELVRGGQPTGLVPNEAFLPNGETAATAPLLATTLALAETEMGSDFALLATPPSHGQRADLFPGVTFSLVSDGGTIIPVERRLMRATGGNSYWDIALGAGRTWAEASDDGLSRAVFPFQLSNILENDTHHGLGTFLYGEGYVSPVRIQIAVQTKTFVVPGTFDAWGCVPVEASPLDQSIAMPAVQSFQRENDSKIPLRPWEAQPGDVPPALLDAVRNGPGADTEIVSGLVINDEVYATEPFTRAGPYPFPRAMKFGIWSCTKTAFGTMAALRLAQITDEDPRGACIADLLPEARGQAQWDGVTIGHCLNMASGIGTANPHTEGTNIFSDYLLDDNDDTADGLGRKSYDHYFAWFLARSQTEKNAAALACDGYPWGPDEVARYRDQDLYLAGAAMSAWYKQRFGDDKRLWHLVRDEVYAPIGIHHAIKFETIEDDPNQVVPLTDAGLLLGMDDIARLGKLIHDGGTVNGEQILHSGLLSEIFDPRIEKGLTTFWPTTDGAHMRYHCGTWHVPYVANSGENFWLPTMVGYGGQIIQILPNGMIAFRFGYDPTDDDRYDALRLARISDAIEAF